MISSKIGGHARQRAQGYVAAHLLENKLHHFDDCLQIRRTLPSAAMDFEHVLNSAHKKRSALENSGEAREHPPLVHQASQKTSLRNNSTTSVQFERVSD